MVSSNCEDFADFVFFIERTITITTMMAGRIKMNDPIITEIATIVLVRLLLELLLRSTNTGVKMNATTIKNKHLKIDTRSHYLSVKLGIL